MIPESLQGEDEKVRVTETQSMASLHSLLLIESKRYYDLRFLGNARASCISSCLGESQSPFRKLLTEFTHRSTIKLIAS